MSTMSAFERASAVTPFDDGAFRVDIPDGWQQGRGAFGGLVLAALLRAMQAHESDPARRTRALTGELCGPVQPGEATIRVTRLRRGNNASTLDAVLWQGGEVQARASAVLGAARDVSAPTLRPDAPSSAAWADVPVAPVRAPMGPSFARHYEYRVSGPAPFTAGPDAVAEGFVREVEPLRHLDDAAVIARLDAWWPALFSVESSPRAIATVSFKATLLRDLDGIAADVPMLHRARVLGLAEGYFAELRELWFDGALVAVNQQTFAILK